MQIEPNAMLSTQLDVSGPTAAPPPEPPVAVPEAPVQSIGAGEASDAEPVDPAPLAPFEPGFLSQFDMRFKIFSHASADALDIKVKLRVRVEAQIENFGAKVREEVRGRVPGDRERDDRLSSLSTDLEMRLKVEARATIDDDEGTDRIAAMISAFTALFRGFSEGLAETLGTGQPASGTVTGAADGSINASEADESGDDRAVQDAALSAGSLTAHEEADVEEPPTVHGAQTTVVDVERPAEESPFESLFHRLSELFSELTTGILDAFGEAQRGSGESDRDAETAAFASLRLDARIRLAYGAPGAIGEGEPDSTVDESA